MKIFPGPILWKDPIGWAQREVGIKFNFWLFIFLQVSAGALTVYLFIIDNLSLVYVLMLVFIFIILKPFYYMYALRKLVLEFQKRERNHQVPGYD